MMRSPGPGGFLGLGHALRSLTTAPMNSVMQQVHRQARAHLETGGVAVPASKDAKKPPAGVEDFVLPKDIEPGELIAAIDAKLLGRGGSEAVLQRKPGGRMVIPAAHLLRLGEGDFPKGRRYLHGLVWAIRRQRMRRK